MATHRAAPVGPRFISTELACHGSLARNQQDLGRAPHGGDHRLGLRGGLAHALPSPRAGRERLRHRGARGRGAQRRGGPGRGGAAAGAARAGEPREGRERGQEVRRLPQRGEGRPDQDRSAAVGRGRTRDRLGRGLRVLRRAARQGRAVDLREHLRVHPWPERLGSGHQNGVRRDQEPRGPGRPPGLSAHARGSSPCRCPRRQRPRPRRVRSRRPPTSRPRLPPNPRLRASRLQPASRRSGRAGGAAAASEQGGATEQTAAVEQAEPAAPAAATQGAGEQAEAGQQTAAVRNPRPKAPRRPALRQPALQAGSPLCSPMPIPTPAPRTRENAPPVTPSTRADRPSSARRSGA